MPQLPQKLLRQVRGEPLGDAYVSAIRTAVRNNSSAYGFSGAVTGTYGVSFSHHGHSGIVPTILFVIGVASAFMAMELVVSRIFTREIDSDPRSVVSVASAINLVSMGSAIACGYGGAQVTGGAGWYLAGLASTATYLVVDALDVLVARLLLQRYRSGG